MYSITVVKRAELKGGFEDHALLNCPLSTYEKVLDTQLPPPRFRDFGELGGYLAANLFPAIGSLDGIRSLLRAGLERMADEGQLCLARTILAGQARSSWIFAPRRFGTSWPSA